MKNNYVFRSLLPVFIGCLLAMASPLRAQVITYTDNFTNGVPATATQIAAWNAWRASLIALPYYKIKVTGSVGPTLKECLDPVIVQDIALKLNTLPGPVTTNAFSWVDGLNTWQVGTDISGRLGVNMTSLSNCDNPGYVIKPGIANLNWGGWGTATCSAPSQTITIEFWYGPPCTTPTGLGASNILSTSATVSWTAVPSSFGYDYVVDQSPGNPAVSGTATALTTANVTGLVTNTTYYLHVRNKCSSTSISNWVHYMFKTLPPCYPPIGFNTTGLTPNYTNINWAVWPSALTYDYLVDQNRADPVSSTGVVNTAATTAPVPGLSENTWYYVHIRSKCASNEVSNWSLDSFLTPIVCRAPVVQISHINTDEAVAYWDAVPTAYEYEYAITQSATPPAIGTKYGYLSIHTSALTDGKEYFIHIRSHCESLGAKTMSDWASVSFKTFATGIDDKLAGGFGITCYPNPVKDVMNISIGGNKAGNAALILTDISGRVLQSIKVTSADLKIDMSGLPQGMYLLKYKDDARARVMPVSKY